MLLSVKWGNQSLCDVQHSRPFLSVKASWKIHMYPPILEDEVGARLIHRSYICMTVSGSLWWLLLMRSTAATAVWKILLFSEHYLWCICEWCVYLRAFSCAGRFEHVCGSVQPSSVSLTACVLLRSNRCSRNHNEIIEICHHASQSVQDVSDWSRQES